MNKCYAHLMICIACCLMTACTSLPGDTPQTAGLQSASVDTVTFTLTPDTPVAVPVAGMAPGELSVGLDGSLYLCDIKQARVVRIDRSGQLLATFSDIDSRARGAFETVDVSVAGGIEVYVLDGASSRVLRLDRNLRNATTVYAPERRTASIFGAFRGIAFDPVSGDLFISDQNAGTIRRIDMLGGNIHETGVFGSASASLRGPAGIHCGTTGELAVADQSRGVIAVQRHFSAELLRIGEGVLHEPKDVVWIDEEHVAVADRDGVKILDMQGRLVGAVMDKAVPPRAITWHEGMLYTVDGFSVSIRRYRVTPAGAE